MGDRPHQAGGPTKRDIVWEQKRQQFMARQRNQQQQPGPPPQQFQQQQHQQQPPPQPQNQASNPAVWSGQSQVSEGFNPAGPVPRRSSASSLGSARSGLSSAGSNSLPVAPAPPFPQQQQPNTGAIQGFPERPQQYEPNPAIRPPETADQAHYPSHQPFNQAAQQQQAYSNAPQQPPAPLPPQIQPQHMQQHHQHQQPPPQQQMGTPQSRPAPFAVDSLDAFTKNNPTAGAIGAAAHQQQQRGQQYPPQSSGGRSTRSQTSSVPWGTDSDVDSARMSNRRKNMGSERPF